VGTARWLQPAGGDHHQRDADSKHALADVHELCASAEARASAVIKQEEDLAVRAC
jgi:hypothetical protein